MVAILVATVITLSKQVGPALTGMVVAFPVALLSLMLIFHPRMGGPAAAAVLANCMLGMIGFGLFCLTLHLDLGAARGCGRHRPRPRGQRRQQSRLLGHAPPRPATA